MDFALPQDFVHKMTDILGQEVHLFLDSYQENGYFGLRVNTQKIEIERFLSLSNFALSPIPWAPEGFYFDPETKPGRHPYHDAGMYYIQEPSAMAPALLLSPKPGDRVLDLCAAPGGKGAQLASALKGEGLIVANEIHPSRVRILGENFERMGITNAVITQETPDALATRFPSFFDRILVDAPCSGEGMFRRHTEARREWLPETPLLCSVRQQDILNAAAKMLKSEGFLVYSTCTFSPEENEGVLATFLKMHPDFKVQGEPAFYSFSRGNPSCGEDLPEISGAYRIWPHKEQGEGHFMALLRKIDGTEEPTLEEHRFFLDSEPATSRPLLVDFMKGILNQRLPSRILNRKGHLFIPARVNLPIKGLKVLRPGLYLGQELKDRFAPSHALALASKPEQVIKTIDLPVDSIEIKKYLRGETLSIHTQKGWILVVVDGCSLGWGKGADGVLKNHYPKSLRCPS